MRSPPDDPVHTNNFNWPWFIVGCVVLLSAIVAFFWAFSLHELKRHHYVLLTWLLPLASGFACGSFAGSIKLSTKGTLAIAATGGFAVWVLTNYFLPKPETPVGRTAAFWARSKTGTNPRLYRFPFDTLVDCLEAERSFPLPRFLVPGCGCNNPEPPVDELKKGCENHNDIACEMLRTLRQPAPARPLDVASIPKGTNGNWRFWFMNGSTLLEEGFGNPQECFTVQWDWVGGPIVFGCSEVNSALLQRAKEECMKKSEFGCDFLKSVTFYYDRLTN